MSVCEEKTYLEITRRIKRRTLMEQVHILNIGRKRLGVTGLCSSD